jgi:hypothetical protein
MGAVAVRLGLPLGTASIEDFQAIQRTGVALHLPISRLIHKSVLATRASAVIADAHSANAKDVGRSKRSVAVAEHMLGRFIPKVPSRSVRLSEDRACANSNKSVKPCPAGSCG